MRKQYFNKIRFQTQFIKSGQGGFFVLLCTLSVRRKFWRKKIPKLYKFRDKICF